MESKSLWLWQKRKLFDILDVILFLTGWDNLVDTTLGVSVSILHSFWADVSLKDIGDEARIEFLCYTTTIINDGTESI